MLNDDKLISLILNGDTNKYDELMIKYSREILKYIYNLTSSYETTEDLMQEVFEKVYYGLSKFNSEKASFRTYLYRVAHNHVINFLKSKSFRNFSGTVSIEETLFTSSENIIENIIKDEDLEEIIFLIDRILNKKAKDILYMHFFSDLSVNEIAESLNLPIKNVYHTIDYSIKKIRKEVRTDG